MSIRESNTNGQSRHNEETRETEIIEVEGRETIDGSNDQRNVDNGDNELAVVRDIGHKDYEEAINDLLQVLVKENGQGVSVKLEVYHDENNSELMDVIHRANKLVEGNNGK